MEEAVTSYPWVGGCRVTIMTGWGAVILSFLQELFALGPAESTIRVFLAGVSTVHDKCDDVAPEAQPLTVQFLLRVRWNHPLFGAFALHRFLFSWDLQVGIKALSVLCTILSVPF